MSLLKLTSNKNEQSQGDLAMKTTINWETELHQALKRAKGESKPILLDFFNPN